MCSVMSCSQCREIVCSLQKGDFNRKILRVFIMSDIKNPELVFSPRIFLIYHIHIRTLYPTLFDQL